MRRLEPRSGETPQGLGRPFTGLWGAAAASNLADGVVVVALPLVALGLTDSPAALAAVTVAATAAWPLFGLPAGLLVDTRDRRALLIWANAGRAAVLIAVALAWGAGVLTLPLLALAALALGLGEVLTDTTLTSTVPQLVAPSRRGVANARLETTINVLNQLAGPPLAGFLMATGVALTAGTAAAAYGLALLGVALFVPRLATAAAPRRTSPRPTLTGGLRELWRNALLRVLTLLTAGMNLVWGAWTAVFVLYAISPGPLGLSVEQYGLVLAGMALGGMAIAPAVDALARRVRVRALLVLDLLGTVALVAPTALGIGQVPVIVGLIVAGAGSTVWRTVVATIRQNTVADEVLGRTYAASRIVSWGAAPLGAAAAGVLSEIDGVRTAMACFAGLAVVVTAIFPLVTGRFDLDAAYRGTVEHRRSAGS